MAGDGSETLEMSPTPKTAARVLIVEDNRKCMEVCRRFFETLSCAVEAAPTGHQAIILLQNALQSGNPFDLISLDLNLSEEDSALTGLDVLIACDSMCAERRRDFGLLVISGIANPDQAEFVDWLRVKKNIAGVAGVIARITHLDKNRRFLWIDKPLHAALLEGTLQSMLNFDDVLWLAGKAGGEQPKRTPLSPPLQLDVARNCIIDKAGVQLPLGRKPRILGALSFLLVHERERGRRTQGPAVNREAPANRPSVDHETIARIFVNRPLGPMEPDEIVRALHNFRNDLRRMVEPYGLSVEQLIAADRRALERGAAWDREHDLIGIEEGGDLAGLWKRFGRGNEPQPNPAQDREDDSAS